MAFEDLREKLKDQMADLNSKIQENSTFNNLREQFEAQSPAVQKAIIAGVMFLSFMFLISFPWSYIGESQVHMEGFEENRGLIQGLLRASRAAKEPSPLPPPMNESMLRSQIEAIQTENRLIPEQRGEITAAPDKPAKGLAPDVVVQTGLIVQLKKLNLDQVINLSHRFQAMGSGTKLMGLDVVQSAGQTHYYDMIAHIVNFGLPEVQIEEPPETKKPTRGGSAKKPPKPSADEELNE